MIRRLVLLRHDLSVEEPLVAERTVTLGSDGEGGGSFVGHDYGEVVGLLADDGSGSLSEA